MTALLSQKINPSINILSLNFENALPYWISAYDEVLEIIKEHTKNIPNQQRLLQAIRMLCHPDPRKEDILKILRK